MPPAASSSTATMTGTSMTTATAAATVTTVVMSLELSSMYASHRLPQVPAPRAVRLPSHHALAEGQRAQRTDHGAVLHGGVQSGCPRQRRALCDSLVWVPHGYCESRIMRT